MTTTIRHWMDGVGFEFLIVALAASTIVLCLGAVIAKGCSKKSAAFRFLVATPRYV